MTVSAKGQRRAIANKFSGWELMPFWAIHSNLLPQKVTYRYLPDASEVGECWILFVVVLMT